MRYCLLYYSTRKFRVTSPKPGRPFFTHFVHTCVHQPFPLNTGSLIPAIYGHIVKLLGFGIAELLGGEEPKTTTSDDLAGPDEYYQRALDSI